MFHFHLITLLFMKLNWVLRVRMLAVISVVGLAAESADAQSHLTRSGQRTLRTKQQ